MGIEVILGGVAFIGLFAMWVVLPSKMKKNRSK
jgi:hypothetical protein